MTSESNSRSALAGAALVIATGAAVLIAVWTWGRTDSEPPQAGREAGTPAPSQGEERPHRRSGTMPLPIALERGTADAAAHEHRDAEPAVDSRLEAERRLEEQGSRRALELIERQIRRLDRLAKMADQQQDEEKARLMRVRIANLKRRREQLRR